MIIEIDMHTEVGRMAWGAAHPTARFMRSDGSAFIDTALSARYLQRRQELATSLGKNEMDLTQEDWERSEQQETEL
jgi:hypothetical protein